MITLDHTVLRIRNLDQAIRFYQEVLGFKHEGKLDRFEIIRVHDGFSALQMSNHRHASEPASRPRRQSWSGAFHRYDKLLTHRYYRTCKNF